MSHHNFNPYIYSSEWSAGNYYAQPNNMVIMENYYSQDHLRGIWQKIDKLHLSYLEMEDSPEKIEQRNRLEDCIGEFLCVASHSQKFYFPATEEVLQRSASSKKDFSGYKAATGWNAIQLYAGNLLSQPWRKEYRTIKTYCGFYKHQIEANLVGAELMFEAMGYKHTGDGVLVLEGPICPDRVANVSKDSLVAYVECQILKAIWEEVSTSFNITWLDVLDFRKTHLGSPGQSIKALKYRHHQRQYQEHTRSYSQGSIPYQSEPHKFGPVPVPVPVQDFPPTPPVNHSFPPLTTHHQVLSMPPQNYPQYAYANGGCCSNNYPTYVSHPQHVSAYGYIPSYPQNTAPKQQFNTNGYYYSNGYAAPPQVVPPYAHPVPTAQLIELEQPHSNGYDSVDGGPSTARLRRTSKEVTANNDVLKNRNNNEVRVAGKEREGTEEGMQFDEDWDYVYRNLESQGYSKDLGERGDVLITPSTDRRRLTKDATTKKVKSTNLDEAMNNLVIAAERPLKITEALEKIDRRSTVVESNKPQTNERRHSQGSSTYENLSQGETKVAKATSLKAAVSSYAKTKSLPRDKRPSPGDATSKVMNTQAQTPSKQSTAQQQSKTLDLKKPKDDNVTNTVSSGTTSSKQEQTTNWQCKSCTYLNTSPKDVCEMCSKSRSTAQEQPMEIGGSECSKCTLVNPKNLKVCEACGASLKNSPTYI